MRFKTNIGRWDLVRMQARVYWSLKPALYSLAMWTVIIAAIIASIKGIPKTPWNWFALLISGAGGALGSTILVWFASMFWMYFATHEPSGSIGDHEFELRDDGLFEKTAANETLTKWSAIKSVIRSANSIYIQVAPGLFHLIPRATFETKTEFDACYEELVRRTKKAA